MQNQVQMWNKSEYCSETGRFMQGKYRMISELKSNDCLKVDGRKVDVLLLGLRNNFNLHLFRGLLTLGAPTLIKSWRQSSVKSPRTSKNP